MNKQLLDKYFKGHCSEQEVAEVEAYLSLPETPAMDEWMMETWEAANGEEATPKPKIHRLWYRVAAAILGAIGLLSFLWQAKQQVQQQIAVKWDTLTNHSNKVQLFTMPDGSEVWLNAHAAVSYNYNYNQTNRELWLSGEGYFKVVKDDQRPFRVHTGQLVTTVLGTEFNIATANKADGSIQVSLIQGKVSVSMRDTFTKVLLPGQMLQYKNGEMPVLQQFSNEEVLDWKQGKIYFDRTTLADALTKLQQRYGCSIILDDASLADKKISGEFRTDLSIDKILSTLEYVHNLKSVRVNEYTYRVSTKHN
ncbi:FecR family protein [Chitinophaga nivalis]|uniref:FecR domain-containing protein n=1 Tax=Chitinophaga nivalis TaxID=2991709 RepID=A0ABT3IUX6_9BACT|nr:FecR domain-containing protein [Chitinophaga nivalis]MCW3462815.1 FecR domain-containing protein [Chitinophaga nivalis]MCW3487495.1 FecR domain-containing protein [Chitinophaga nivalis]